MTAEESKSPSPSSSFGWLTKFMAYRCEHCPLCKYAREKPDTPVGKIMQWHGKWCPFWKSREKVYGSGS